MADILTIADNYKLEQLDKLRARKEGLTNLIAALQADMDRATAELASISELDDAVTADFKPAIDKVEAIAAEKEAIIVAEIKAREEAIVAGMKLAEEVVIGAPKEV